MPRLSPSALFLLALLAARSAFAYPTVEGHPAAYVIITGDALVPAFQPLADWKTQTGVPAVIRPLSAVLAAHPIAFDDAERVRLEIRDAWAAGAHWVLLGGDHTVVPVRYATTTFFGGWLVPTDLYYQCLERDWDADGDHLFGEGFQSSSVPGDDADLTPEVFLGRAPVATPTEAQAFVARTVGYERTPAGNYEHLGLECAEVLFPTNWAPGDPVSLDGADLVEPLLPLFDLHPSLHVARLYENDTDPSRRPGALHETFAAVRDSLNAGSNQVLIVGNGDFHSVRVGDGVLAESDFAGLTNGPRRFNLYTVGPASTALDSGGIGRAAMLAPGGGAVSCVGASLFDFPTAARQYLQEYFRLMDQDSVAELGAAAARSRLPFIPFSTFDGVNRWTQMTQTLLGDPQLQQWTGPVRTLLVMHAPQVILGDTELDVAVKIGPVPLAGARVAAWWPGQFLGVAITDASGHAHVPISTPALGTFKVTVTAYDARPRETTVQVVMPPTPALASLVSAEVTDAGVELTGYVTDGAGTEFTLQRFSVESDWTAVDRALPDGSGLLRLVDHAVEPGARYRYRLGFLEDGVQHFSGELAVEIPAGPSLAIALAGGQASAEPLRVRLSLPRAGAARIEMIDATGRRTFSRDLGEQPAGDTMLRLPDADGVAPGLYFVRLTHEGRSAVTRFVRMR